MLVLVLQLHPYVGVCEPLHPRRDQEASAKFVPAARPTHMDWLQGVLIHKPTFYKTLLFISVEY